MCPVQVSAGSSNEMNGGKGRTVVSAGLLGSGRSPTHARPKSLSLMCPSGSNKKF